MIVNFLIFITVGFFYWLIWITPDPYADYTFDPMELRPDYYNINSVNK